jgi:hypothetical protein
MSTRILLWCILFSSPAWQPTEPSREHRNAYELDAGDVKGRGVLVVDSRKALAGERINVTLTYENGGAGHAFFNPFFNGLLPYPGTILIYDSQKRYVADLLNPVAGSRRTPNSTDWVYIPGSEGFVGAKLRVRLPKVSLGGDGPAAGKYYLQAIYFRAFVEFDRHTPPDMTLEQGMHFYDDFDRTELFRSNVVEIELLPPAE